MKVHMAPSLAVLTVMIGRLLEPESWNGEEVRGGGAWSLSRAF